MILKTPAHRTLSLLLISLISLSSCTPYVNPPTPAALTEPALAGAAGGAAVGAMVSATTGGSFILGPAVGAAIGLGVGWDLASTHKMLTHLACEGVQVIQVGDNLRLILPADKIFEFNTATLLARQEPTLMHVAYFLERYHEVPIVVAGYTDNVRSDDRNLALTQHQAETVVAYLWAHGVPYYHLHAIGHGAAAPVASNGNPVGSAFNRRIEISLPVFSQHYLQG